MIDLQINPFTFALYFLAAAYFAVAEVFQSFGFFPLLITSGLSSTSCTPEARVPSAGWPANGFFSSRSSGRWCFSFRFPVTDNAKRKRQPGPALAFGGFGDLLVDLVLFHPGRVTVGGGLAVLESA